MKSDVISIANRAIVPMSAITWRLTSSVTSASDPLGGTDWEKATEDYDLEHGAQLPAAEDIVTLTVDGAGNPAFGFAETGLYMVMLMLRGYTYDGGGSPPACKGETVTVWSTDDGDQAVPTYGSMGGLSFAIPAITGGNTTYQTGSACFLINVTDFEKDFLKLSISPTTLRIAGATASNYSTVTFIRLG